MLLHINLQYLLTTNSGSWSISVPFSESSHSKIITSKHAIQLHSDHVPNVSAHLSLSLAFVTTKRNASPTIATAMTLTQHPPSPTAQLRSPPKASFVLPLPNLHLPVPPPAQLQTTCAPGLNQ